ncbi:MAG: type II toxin-antitoxin system RelE/ParE family toxin [Deltaproteobacteria bacterium]|nr:type II toxin-antitoxin system RelE/ParE family toxin [Deltaproteobacteria bacterium]
MSRRRTLSPEATPVEVQWTPRARNDLVRIGDYIAEESPGAASRWVATLVAAADDIGGAPLTGRRVPELERDEIREVIEGRDRIVYRVAGGQFEILTVFEGNRLMPIGDDEAR